MPAQTAATLSDPPIVDHLLFLAPDPATARRLRGEFAAAGLLADGTRRGLRVAVGVVDWRGLLETIGGTLGAREKRGTRVAVIARGADEKVERRAIALARPLAEILDGYSDGWLCELMGRRALRVHFQPLVQYPPGRVHGYECLVRGIGPGGRRIGPARLFEAAGRSGMTYLLDLQSCETAAARAADTGFANVQFFINVMAGAIANPAVHAESALAAVETGGLRAGQITFEIVDAEACGDRKGLAQILRNYREAGFRTSLDDVGRGAASLVSLEDLRPDYIKLDSDLCRGAAVDAARAALLQRLSETARRHGVIAIAKGIETEEQLRFVIDAGIPVTQGYVHARPAPTPLDADREDQVLRRVRRTAVLAA